MTNPTIRDEPTFCPTCDSDRTERKMLPDIWWCANCGNTFDGPSGLGHRTIAHLTAENVRLRSLLDDALTALAVADQAPELRDDITAALAGGS